MRTKKIALPFLFLLILSIFTSIILVTAQSSLTVTVSTDKPTTMDYNKYDPITLNGTLMYGTSTYPDNGLVAIEVDYPSSSSVMVLRTVVTGSGPLSGMDEIITSAYPTSTFQGSQTSSFGNGTQAYFTVAVTDQGLLANQNAPISMQLAITLFDGNGIPLGIQVEPILMSKGQAQTAYFQIAIPVTAHTGKAYGYVDLYSNLPHSDGVPMATEYPIQFTITGTSVPSSGPAPSTASASAGAYSFTFKLPSAHVTTFISGTYKVYATATYAGSNTQSPGTAGFTVRLIGDFTGAGTVTGNDLFVFASSYIDYYNNEPYNPLCDINHDGVINGEDFFLFVAAYVQYWSSS